MIWVIVFLLYCSLGHASDKYDFTVDGLYFTVNADGATCALVSPPSSGTTREYYKGDIVIPSTVKYNENKYVVTEIAVEAFAWGKALLSVQIPTTVRTVGNRAFSNCSLKTVVFNGKYINDYAFYNCSELQSVIAPNVKAIGKSAFEKCSKLNELVLGDSLKSVYEYAFKDCSSLGSICLTETVSKIEDDAFFGCDIHKDKFINLSTLDATQNKYWGAVIYDTKTDDGFFSLGDTLVRYRGNASHLVIPGRYRVIAKNAGSYCKVDSITIENGVERIEGNALRISSLKSVKLPRSVTSIGEFAIEKDGTSDGTLETVLYPYGIASLNNGSVRTKQNPAFIPKSISYIGRNNINACKNVIFEDHNGKVTFQDRNASDGYFPSTLAGCKNLYAGCNLEAMGASYAGELLSGELDTLVIGKQVTSFCGYVALRQVTSIDVVTCLSKKPFKCPEFPTTATKFLILQVPLGSKEAWASDADWSRYCIKEVESLKINHSDSIEAYTPDFDIDLTSVADLKAYAATGCESDTVTFEQVFQIPAGAGVILVGKSGNYKVPCCNMDNETIPGNKLQGTISGTYVINDVSSDTINYCLETIDGEVSFVPAGNVYAHPLGRNKAFLCLPAKSAASKNYALKFVDAIPSGIKSVQGASNVGDERYFNVYGQEVNAETKGIIIRNGKKYINR